MKLIVDSSILFAGLIKDSTTRWLLFHIDAELLTVDFSYHEVKKHQELICQKSKLTEVELFFILNKMREKLTILPNKEVNTRFEEAYQIMKDIDPQDSMFLAAALAANPHIWSDDLHFQKQNKVRVWTTKELVKL